MRHRLLALLCMGVAVCIGVGVGPKPVIAHNNNYQIAQTPDHVAILQEHIHDVRFIPLDGRPHVSAAIRQYTGDSRGRWEGDTLVVETVNFKGPFIRRWNRPENSLARGDLTESLRVVERFTRVSPDTLDYQFTVDDAGTWTSPWSRSLPMARTEGPIYEFACHGGNHGLMNILAGSPRRGAGGGGPMNGHSRQGPLRFALSDVLR